MAAKKRRKKRGLREREELNRHRELSRRAHAEAKRLLKRIKEGNITQAQLQTGLKELANDLGPRPGGILGFHYFRI